MFLVFFFNSIFISHQHKRMFFLFLTLPEMTLNLEHESLDKFLSKGRTIILSLYVDG